MSKRKDFVSAIGIGIGACVVLAALAVSSSLAGDGESPKKLALGEVLRARQSVAEQEPQALKTPIPLVTSCPQDVSTLRSKVGIESFPEGKMPPRGLNPVNQAFVFSTSGVPYAIYAGNQAEAPRQGVLLVWEQELDPCASAAGLRPHLQPQGYPTPFREGAVRITRIDGDHVVFATSSGRAGRFDYVTGQFE